MIVRRLHSLAVIALMLCSNMVRPPLVVAQNTGPAHASWVKVAHQLESAPVDASINHDAQIAVQEINNASDFHVTLCTDFFSFFGTQDIARYPYHAQIYLLYVLGAAAYQVDTGKQDVSGATTNGLQSMLRGYAQLTHLHPELRSKQLEELTITALSGKLDAFVVRKGCNA